MSRANFSKLQSVSLSSFLCSVSVGDVGLELLLFLQLYDYHGQLHHLQPCERVLPRRRCHFTNVSPLTYASFSLPSFSDLYNCEDDPCGAALCRNVNKTFECYCPSGQRLVNGTCEGKTLMKLLILVASLSYFFPWSTMDFLFLSSPSVLYLCLSHSTECEWYTWGVECSGTCNCTDNTTTCNPVTGVCPEGEDIISFSIPPP